MKRGVNVEEELKELLNAAGVPWKIVAGGKHRKIYVGDVVAGILGHGRNPGGYSRRAGLNTLSQVRRAIQQVKS